MICQILNVLSLLLMREMLEKNYRANTIKLSPMFRYHLGNKKITGAV